MHLDVPLPRSGARVPDDAEVPDTIRIARHVDDRPHDDRRAHGLSRSRDRGGCFDIAVGVDIRAVLGPQDEIRLRNRPGIDACTKLGGLAHVVVENVATDVHAAHACLRGSALNDSDDGGWCSAHVITFDLQRNQPRDHGDDRRKNSPRGEPQALTGAIRENRGDNGGTGEYECERHPGLPEEDCELSVGSVGLRECQSPPGKAAKWDRAPKSLLEHPKGRNPDWPAGQSGDEGGADAKQGDPCCAVAGEQDPGIEPDDLHPGDEQPEERTAGDEP